MKNKNSNLSFLRTDLIIDGDRLKGDVVKRKNIGDIKLIKTKSCNWNYSTICFKDITDHDNFFKVQKIFIQELGEYINKRSDDVFLIIGLGNDKSTPDSLGPLSVSNILVTRYLFLLGDVEDGYSNVSSFVPNVMGNTGIETADIVKSIIKQTKATKVIMIDSLKTNTLNRLTHTIQITDKGICPGSGIYNNRVEISKKTMGIDVISIGVPTVVDICSILKEGEIEDSFIVTPTDIDFIIEKLGILIGNGINIYLHDNFIRQNNN